MAVDLKKKYGSKALVAGASEGLGAAFATYLARAGMDVVLVARRKEPLELLAAELRALYAVQVDCLCCDLADINAATNLQQALMGNNIDVLVYNAALSYIGPFENNTPQQHQQLAIANMITPMQLMHAFGGQMLRNGKGAIVLMASLAGFQGSGFLSAYAASKAFDRVLAESLWYEWKDRGVDVMACCAGATATPNFLQTKPGKTSFLAPKVQTPEAVVAECFEQLGKRPSYITGTGNRIASFFMQRLMSRKMAITIMGDTTRQMYRL
ncbi:MAG: SDR family NAD(P)-dependent oxidoreductase [Chitinophagales bacterium]